MTEEQKAAQTAVLDRKIQETKEKENSLLKDLELAVKPLQQQQRKNDKKQAARDKKVITTTTRMR